MTIVGNRICTNWHFINKFSVQIETKRWYALFCALPSLWCCLFVWVYFVGSRWRIVCESKWVNWLYGDRVTKTIASHRPSGYAITIFTDVFFSLWMALQRRKGGCASVFADVCHSDTPGTTVNVLHLFLVNLLPYKSSQGKFTSQQNSVWIGMQ